MISRDNQKLFGGAGGGCRDVSVNAEAGSLD
jgi:hypothetical protein